MISVRPRKGANFLCDSHGLSLREASIAIFNECEPIDMAIIWKNSVDDYWHSCDDSCSICRSIPCMYKE